MARLSLHLEVLLLVIERKRSTDFTVIAVGKQVQQFNSRLLEQEDYSLCNSWKRKADNRRVSIVVKIDDVRSFKPLKLQ